MNKIRVEINPVTNYVFHMLSAAGVGYDNDYGRRWRHTLPEEDIALLKSYAQQLTVKGGEHCGEWYHPLVIVPARGEVLPEDYYAAVADPAMAEVCRVMGGHYQAYLKDVYPESLREVQPYAAELQRMLDESSLTERAEALVGETIEGFRVMLVNSVARGPEAIDISEDQDVFGMGRTCREEMLFIGHEYIIYLLKKALEGTAAFQTMDTWPLTEGLAEFYLLQLYGDIGFFRQVRNVVDFYQRQKSGLSVRELYLRAEAWALLHTIAREYQAILGDNLRGVYAHGSMAFGCFDPAQSDMDFLVVVEQPPTEEQKARMLEILLLLDEHAPAKGFEMSVVLAKDCAVPVHPVPFCLHFSNAHKAACQQDVMGYVARMKGEDPDLAAHFTVTRAVGKTIWGAPVKEIFGEVKREDYLASILGDVENAVEDVRENPVYVILNLCRVLAAWREGAVLSKEQGGAWGLANLPEEYHGVIRAALTAYQTGDACTVDGRAFAAWALGEITGKEILAGGSMNASLEKQGDVLRRGAAWHKGTHDFLRYMEEQGFEDIPRFRGIDEQGREMLTFLPGESVGDAFPDCDPFIWSEENLLAAARFLRRYHDASAGFLPRVADWPNLRFPRSEWEVICHNDAAPYNFVYQNHVMTGLIDFDVAAPGPRMWDIAYTLYTCVPLASYRLEEEDGRRERVRRFFEAYGMEQPKDWYEWVIRRIRGMVELIEGKAAEGDPVFTRMLENGDAEHYRREVKFLESRR